MNNRRVALVALLVSFSSIATHVHADFWSKLRDKSTQVLSGGVDIVLAPHKATLDALSGKDLGKIADDSIDSYVKAVNGVADLSNLVSNEAVNQVRNNFGKIAADVVLTAITPMQLAQSAGVTSFTVAADVLKEQDLSVIAGAPLASAIRHAKSYYESEAKPLPTEIKFLLSQSFDAAVLNNARYVVSRFETNLPAIINEIRTKLGERHSGNHAVTIDNIIVFAKAPSVSDIYFWAHELQHVAQYMTFGIDAFSAQYSLNHRDIEREAERKGEQAANTASKLAKYAHIAGGKPFVIKLYPNSAEAGCADHQAAIIGNLISGDSYVVQYDPFSHAWIAVGRNQGFADCRIYSSVNDVPGHPKFHSMVFDPGSPKIKIWGGVFTLDTQGNIYYAESGSAPVGQVIDPIWN